ncbi:MAG: FecR domain-containing protein [Lachnospiraceae bacterium]|nr:FecR domain-containing protein [Lachnospiraceae bacterium]
MKKKILIPIIAGVLAIIGVVLFLVFTSDDSYYSIKILETKGTVNVDRDKQSFKAEEGLKMRDKDYLTVSDDGFARIDCDRSTFARFEHDTEAAFIANSEKKLKIKLVKGEMVVEVQKEYESGESLNIVTPNTVMAIRGTVVAVRCIPTSDGGTRTVNYCLEGKAEVSTDDGQSVTIKAGEGWLTVSDSEGEVIENKAAGAEEFEFADIDVDELEGADGNPMKLSYVDTDTNTNTNTSTPIDLDWDGSPVELNEKNFPDMIFRLYLMDNIDSDGDMVLSPSELAIEKMDVRSSGINDLKGIEYFTRLTFLNCSKNGLTSLDVSNNKELVELYCADNDLVTLNVSGCEKLKNILCNDNDLEKLDVSNAKNLDILNCSNNSLLQIDISNNTNLTNLQSSGNPFISLDVSHNPKLYSLYCERDQLNELDVSQNPALQILYCGENMIDTLDLSNNKELRKLNCDTTDISELDVSNNTKMVNLICSTTNITKLDVSMLPDLEELRAGFTKVTTLDLSHNPKLKVLNIMYAEIKEVDIRNNPNITGLYVDGSCNVIK